MAVQRKTTISNNENKENNRNVAKRTSKSDNMVLISLNDMEFIKEAIKKNEQTLLKLSEKIDGVEKTCAELNTAIVGNDKYGHEGILDKLKTHDEFINQCKTDNVVNNVKKHEEYISTDKDFKSKLVGGGIALGAFWTLLLKFWDKIF